MIKIFVHLKCLEQTHEPIISLFYKDNLSMGAKKLTMVTYELVLKLVNSLSVTYRIKNVNKFLCFCICYYKNVTLNVRRQPRHR